MLWQMVLLCLIWGVNWAVMSTALDYFPPLTFSALRFVLGSVVLLAICFYKRIPWPDKQSWKWFALCGLLQTAYVFSVTQSVLQYLTVGVTSILAFTMPLWVTILAHFFIPDERLKFAHILGLSSGILGLFLVLDVNPLEMTWTGVTIVAQLFVLSSSVAWATSNIIIKKVLHAHDKIQFTTYQMLIGTVGLLLASFFVESWRPITWSWMAVFCLMFAGVIASAIAYILWTNIISKGEAGRSSISLMAVPVIGALSGWVFLGETLAWKTMFGIFFVVAGIGIVNMKEFRTVKRSAADQNKEISLHDEKGAM